MKFAQRFVFATCYILGTARGKVGSVLTKCKVAGLSGVIMTQSFEDKTWRAMFRGPTLDVLSAVISD